MSRLSVLPSQIQRSESRASVAESSTTYHSFHDMDYELTEPPSAPRNKEARQPHPSSTEMNRQDSGYESLPPRASQSSSRRRTSTTSSTTSRPKSRPSTRRASKASSYLQQQTRTSGTSLYHTGSHPQPLLPPRGAPAALQFYQFPPPPPADHPAEALVPVDTLPSPPPTGESPFQAPPTTTHYWTSDRTRRLEYAAIDAASRGVKGWVMRHLVPDCFVPRESRRLGFDDDGGSVRRYRLELEEGEDESGMEKSAFGVASSSASVSSSVKRSWGWSGRKVAGPSGSVGASCGVY